MAALLLGIDVGTTGTKGVLVDPSSGVVATASRPATLHSPHAGFAEADTSEWWSNVCSLVPELLSQTHATSHDISALATTGMVPAVVCLGHDGPVRAAILQNDARAVAEIAELAVELAHLDLLALSGSPLSQQSVAPTIRWLARHDPQGWAATENIVGSYDWLAHALGAELHVEFNWALESGLFDLRGCPIDDVVAAASMSPAVVPPVARSATVVGAVSREAASSTGLLAGTSIVTGGADHVLSAYAAGLREQGDLLIKLGGAGDILMVTNDPLIDRRLYLDAHPIEGRWLPNGCMATSGSLIRWTQSLTGGEELTTLDIEAAQRPAGEILCLPYFLGEKSPLHDPNLRGAFVGLHLGHDRASMHRAVLEAIAFGFRHHLEVFAERGVEPRSVYVTNGGSKSTLWKQILADVLDLSLTPVLDHPGASLGAALAAGVGTGAFSSWDAAMSHAQYGAPILADPSSSAHYSERYSLWRQLGQAVTEISHALAVGSPR